MPEKSYKKRKITEQDEQSEKSNEKTKRKSFIIPRIKTKKRKPKDSDTEKDESGEDDEDRSSVKQCSTDLVFRITLSSGIIMKHNFDTFRVSFSVFPMVIDEDGIYYSTSKGDLSIQGVYDANRIVEFETVPKNFSNQKNKSHNIAVKCNEFYSILKNLKTNDSVTIEHYKKSKKLHCILISGNTPQEFNLNLADRADEKMFQPDENLMNMKRPNVKFNLEKFAIHCSSLTKTKKVETFCNFIFYEKGAKFYSDNKSLGYLSIGNCKTKKLGKFRVKPHFVKSLGKSKNFDKKGIVRFYCYDGKQFRIDCNNGSVGDLSFFITKKN